MATLAELNHIEISADQALDSSSLLPILENETQVLDRVIYTQSGTGK